MPPELSSLASRVDPSVESSARASSPPDPLREARVRRLVFAHFDPLWRFMRRLGVASMDLDDAMQEVVLVAVSRLDAISPESERSFLFGTAFRVASEWRRFRGGRREVDDAQLADHADPIPEPGALLDQARARTMLDEVLDAMPLDLRAVFTLYEVEELTMSEIAELLAVPAGTVASRLRRGREHFEAAVTRLQVKAAQGETRRRFRAPCEEGPRASSRFSMIEPPRLHRSKGLGGQLLASAREDRAPPGAASRVLLGTSVGAAGTVGAVVATLSSKSAATTAVSTVGPWARWAAWAPWKWVALSAVGAGAVGAGAVGAGSVATLAAVHLPAPAKTVTAPSVIVASRSVAPVASPSAVSQSQNAPVVVTLAREVIPSANVVTSEPLPVPVTATPRTAKDHGTADVVAPVASLTEAKPTRLAVQIAAIDDAKRTLARGDANGTLQKLDAYSVSFPNGTLAEEASALRIEALVRAGRPNDARERLERFRTEHPGSPLLESLTHAVTVAP